MNSSLRFSFAFLRALCSAMSEKSAFLAKLFLRALCASARVSGQRDFGCGFPRCAFAFGLGLLVTARRFEKRRWRSALQDLAALRKRPLNAPASWSAEREFRFGHKRGPEPSFIQRPECQGNGKKSFQNDAPAHHSRDKHSSGTSPLFLFPSLSSFRLRLAALCLCAINSSRKRTLGVSVQWNNDNCIFTVAFPSKYGSMEHVWRSRACSLK